MVDQWISTDVALPKGTVIVYVHDEDVVGGTMFVAEFDYDYMHFVDHYYREVIFGGVTHWMPLPEPPNGP